MAINKAAQSAETPWGLSWSDLLASLRPTAAELSRLNALVAHISDALRTADLHPVRLEPAGPFGKGTLTTGDLSLRLLAVFHPFHPADYFESHLQPLADAVSAMRPKPPSVSTRGHYVHFVLDDIPVSLAAAADLPAGPALLARTSPSAAAAPPNVVAAAPPASSTVNACAVHAATSCEVLRAAALRFQPPLYKDMVRVARKWLAGAAFLSAADVPPRYLVELLVLASVRAAPIETPGPPVYAAIMRRFLSLLATTASSSPVIGASGRDAAAGDDNGDAIQGAPPTFLWWPMFYDRAVVDFCLARGSLAPGAGDLCPLVVVDPAAPFVNVARSLPDWTEARRIARAAADQFAARDALDGLQDRVAALTENMRETVAALESRVARLQRIEDAPRRWSGVLSFGEAHLNSESWTKVTEVALRDLKWKVNARRARSEGVGYSSFVDVSLQLVSASLEKSLDVDVVFRSTTANLVFDKSNDHMFFAKNSEVIRNREYPVQITVIG